MNRKKIYKLVKGYLLKDKRQTILIGLFLCIMVGIFLVGNQMFDNVDQVNVINAQTLAGKQHVKYYYVPIEQAKVIEKLPYVKAVGKLYDIGSSADGTGFAYEDDKDRELLAEVAHKNIKNVKQGRWAQKEDEVVFTENYMELYHLKIGDTVKITLNKYDSIGELVYTVKNQTLKIVGIIDNKPGFTDEKTGYISKELSEKYIKKYGGEYVVSVELKGNKNIDKRINEITKKIGYTDNTAQVNKNAMLIQSLRDSWVYKSQSIGMNLILWFICILVIYNIFNNRFENRRKEYGLLRGLGFEMKDLRHLIGSEVAVFMIIAFIAGLCVGTIVNKLIYKKMIFAMLEQYDTSHVLTSNITFKSIIITVIMIVLVCIPVLIGTIIRIKNITPANIMKEILDKHIRVSQFRKKRNKKVKNNLYAYTLIMLQKNRKKRNLTIVILLLAVTLISIIAYQRNGSDNGIKYVKQYIPEDLQISIGNRNQEFTLGIDSTSSASFSTECIEKVKKISSIKSIQTYALIDGFFLCMKRDELDKKERRDELDKDTISEIENTEKQQTQKIGKDDYVIQNVIIAATNDIGKLLNSEKGESTHEVILSGYLCQLYKLAIGDKVTIYDSGIMCSDNIDEAKSVEVEVLKTEGLTVLSEEYIGPNFIITDEKTAKELADKLDYKIINIDVKDGKEGQTLYKLNSMPELSDASIRSAKESMKSYEESNSSQEAIRYFFVILLIAIAAITYINSTFANLLSRVKELSMLHKIGVSVKEMYRMILREGLSYSITSVIIILFMQIALIIFDRCTERFIIDSGMIYLFILVDAGVLIICSVVPMIIFTYMHHKNMIYVRKK